MLSNKVTIIRLSVGDIHFEVFGTLPDGHIETSWSLSDQKQACRPFTDMLSTAIPGAILDETPKLWSVAMSKKWRVTIKELLHAKAD